MLLVSLRLKKHYITMEYRYTIQKFESGRSFNFYEEMLCGSPDIITFFLNRNIDDHTIEDVKLLLTW